jgi:hypothetical protein
VVPAAGKQCLDKGGQINGVRIHLLGTSTLRCRLSGYAPHYSMAEAEHVFFNAPLLLLADGAHSQRVPRLHALGKSDDGWVLQSKARAYWESYDSTAHLDWSTAKRAILPNLKQTTKTISLRLPQHLIDSVKIATNARDVPYQSLIKVWLQEKMHSH